MKAIAVHKIRKTVIGDVEIGPLTIEIEQGAVTALVGRNGIGKSTLLKMVMGLIKSDSGVIKVLGKTLDTDEVTIKTETAYVGQRLFGVEHFTLKQLVDMNRQFYPNWQEEKFQRYVDQLNLPLNKKIGKLSLGMQKRSALALGLARDSKLLLLDEPSASLDIDTQRWLVEELIAYMDEDETRSIVIASHIVSEIKQLADYIVMFDESMAIRTYEKDALLEEVKGIWLQEQVTNLPNVIVKSDGRLLIARNCEETLAALQNRKIEPTFIEALELEEIFAYLKHFESMNE